MLRPDAVPGLRRVDLLVEMHDIVRKGCSPTLRGRFEGSHQIDVIATRRRQVADFPAGVAAASDRERREFRDEGRGSTPMTFFWMRAKAQG